MSSNSKYILGISAYYHDSAAAIVCADTAEIIAAAQEERFTRIKHDASFPINAINYCLEMAGIKAKDLQSVVYYEKPFVKFERILETALCLVPKSFRSFIDAMPVWMNQKLFIRREVRKNLSKKLKVYFATHHQSHAASAFFPSPFEQAAIICMDGVGEWTTTSFGTGTGNKIRLLKQIEFPHSLGLLYSAITGFLGFKVNSGEYKVMGLAPYGEPKYTDLILNNLVDVKDDGSFWLNQKYFDYCCGDHMYSKELEELFGRKARTSESALTQDDMDIARSLQEVTEIIVLKIAKYVKEQTGMKNLCLAGGCALNCVANGKILKSGLYENIWVQPAAGDAGGALGAALLGAYHICKTERSVKSSDFQKGSLLGVEFTTEDIKQRLAQFNAVFEQADDVNKAVAQYLADGKIVGRFSGRAEYGPRALGNRSILADPRNRQMQSKLNLAIKKRESFRPFAPSVQEEESLRIFDTGAQSPYMLFTVPVADGVRIDLNEEEKQLIGIDKLKAGRSQLPAITHVDYSARLQTVSKETNPQYWQIIDEFKKLSGFGVVVNTSFNIRGEPLVNTPEDAYQCFMFTDMDVLVLENLVLLKENQPELTGIENYHEQFSLD